MSLATAAKFYNVSPKSNSSSGRQYRVTVDVRKKYMDPGNSSQLSSTSRNLNESNEVISFKPNELGKNNSTIDTGMSFGGPNVFASPLLTSKDSIHDSTLVKNNYEETRDTKMNESEFFYNHRYQEDD